MRMRPLTALAAALALLAAAPAASSAQDPTPTPTAEQSQEGSAAEAPEDAPTEVKRVYDDYRRDGAVDVCGHARADLEETLDTIEPAFDRDYPDFREALETGVKRHDAGRCSADDSSSSNDGAGGGATTAEPTPTGTAGSGAKSGELPRADGGATDDGRGAVGPENGSLSPEDGSAAPADGSAAPPAATAAPPPAAQVPAASPAAAVVTRSGSGGLLVPGILLAVALLGAAALAASALAARRSPRMRHAWREAGYRTRSMWADFSDWLRLGR